VKVITWIKDVVYQIQRHPRAKISGSPRQAGAVPGGYSGRAALRREQYDEIKNANTLVATSMVTRTQLLQQCNYDT
jgi:hypothetical protein